MHLKCILDNSAEQLQLGLIRFTHTYFYNLNDSLFDSDHMALSNNHIWAISSNQKSPTINNGF